MKLFNAFPHAQQLKAPLQLSCKRHYDLFRGKLITDEAAITLSAIVAFQNDVVLLENGETFRLTEGLANALRDYLKDVRQALGRTRPQTQGERNP